MQPTNKIATLQTDDNANFIFKKGNYTNTYIIIDTSGLPDGAQLNLVDENLNQLYSPFDLNGNYIKTRCYITVGQNQAIQLPANYFEEGWNDFAAGIYHWNLKYNGNDYYNSTIIPLEVEVRDFTTFEILTSEVFPDENVTFKCRTYLDTPLANFNFYKENTNELVATTDNNGIAILNIDNTYGQHSIIIESSDKLIKKKINYELKNPIYFYSDIDSGNYGDDVTVGYRIRDDTTLTLKENSQPTITINGSTQNLTQDITLNDLPPGTYHITISVMLSDNNIYTCSKDITISTADCSLSLTLNDTSNTISASNPTVTLLSTYKHNNTPITQATVTLIDTSNQSIIQTGTTNNNGQINFNINHSGTYQAIIVSVDNQTILSSNTYTIIDGSPKTLSFGLGHGGQIKYGESLSATVTAYDKDGNKSVGYPIDFYQNGGKKGTVNTNSNGVANFTYVVEYRADGFAITFEARYGSINSQLVSYMTVVKNTPSISISTNTTSVKVNNSITVSGELKDEFNNYIHNASIKIYNGDVLLGTATTNNGSYSTNINCSSAGTMSLKAVFDGDEMRNNAESSIVSVTVEAKSPSTCSISLSHPCGVVPANTAVTITITASGSGTIAIVIKDSNDNLVSGHSYGRDCNGVLVDTFTPTAIGDYTIHAVYYGNDTYEQSSWVSTPLSVSAKVNSVIYGSTLFAPSLTGNTNVNIGYEYSEANGISIGKGFTYADGWSNSGLWELSFNFKHDDIKYTGICFCSDLNYNGVTGSNNYVWSWEGSWECAENYAHYTSGTVGWFDVKVTKIDSTHLILSSNTLNRKSIVTVDWLPSASRVTFGAVHNVASNLFGPCEIKDVIVRSISVS